MASVYGSSTFARPNAAQYQYHSPDGTSKWKGPRRVFIFCTTAIILPSLLISVPLLMRFVIYGSSTYILHPSDTRIMDQRISTTWCEAETISVNSTFTAYVTQGEPNVVKATDKLPPFHKHMYIPDDQKEYWGFYLLPGSTFTIKTCAKYKGGTLLIVRGNNHMQYCAYVGENDSAGNSDQVSGSASFESKTGKHPGVGGTRGGRSKEKGQDDINILSRLKTFLQSHPGSRGKIQKTLENWMLLNNSRNSQETTKDDSVVVSSTTENDLLLTSTRSSTKDSTDHGTIRRRRRTVDIRPDTESGEDGAFEAEDINPENSTDSNLVAEDDFILPHDRKNVSLSDKSTSRESIWKEQHNQHGGMINSPVTNEDGSMSESESSFSSSEEALLKCEGIIANFKIPHEDSCVEEGTFDSLDLKKPITGMDSNEFRFQVKERDYYYFIFGSENEKETNSIRALFQLEKMEYQLPQPVQNCTSVRECQISFGFASSDKVVIKLPHPKPEANSNLVYMAETVCKPRSHLYLIFVILVPVVILLFAFR